MKIFGARRNEVSRQMDYATATDFCRIFDNDMNRLYMLALLITADRDLAERCFVSGLEDAKASNPVFKDWAESWARRAIIVNAIRLLAPHASRTTTDRAKNWVPLELKGLPHELAAIVSLGAFERFVFVMSVLEGYPERDCRLLLNCSSADFAEARIRALRQLADSAEAVSKSLVNIESLPQELNSESSIVEPLEVPA